MPLRSNNIFILLVSIATALLGFTLSASAATLSIDPSTVSTKVGGEFSVSISIDTEGASINAADVRLEFPSDVLEVVDIDRIGSVFAFWVSDPTYSNTSGTIEFIGGSSKGISGDSLHVLSIKFKTSGVGSGAIVPTSAIVTASDGKGTNVLSDSYGSSVASGSGVFVPEPVFRPEEIKVETPKEIVREAAVAANLPEAPEVQVPLYPDSSKWYSHKNNVTALWNIPDDVTKVAIEVDKKSNTEPSEVEETLVNGKELGVLERGISFIHVQFRNNVGWGDVTHYKVSIDTEPPLPFEITTTSRISDNPTPVITFDTQDALSGISHTLIIVDNNEAIRTESLTHELGPLKPGPHSIYVKVFDYARNSTEDVTEIETLALPTPSISFVSRSVSSGEAVFVTGSAIPNGFVDVIVLNKEGLEVTMKTAETDMDGSWEVSIIESLKTGKYQVFATARDMRGALSYPTERETTSIRSKVIFSLGVVEFGWFEIFLSTLILISIAVGVGAWRYVSEQSLRGAYIVIIVRDIKKFSDLLDGHIKTLEKELKNSKNKIDKESKVVIDHKLEQLKDTTKKMGKYLTEQTKKIR
ncbi:cohesin domain-containing protein [candidate division KSB1 bacterium]